MLSQEKVLFRFKDELHRVIGDVEKYKLGRVLTIVDATVSDQEQRKAMKDLVKDAFYSKEHFTDELGEMINQFCNRLGVYPFTAKMSQEEFIGRVCGGNVPDYFPEEFLQEIPPSGESEKK